MDVQIRLRTEEDLISFHKCLDSIAKEGKYLARTKAPEIELVEKRIKAGVLTKQSQFVALIDNDIVGFCNADRFKPESLSHNAGIGMGVLKDYRGLGIGEKLLIKTMNHLGSSGIRRVELDVREDNLAAIGLYEKCGFEICGRKRNAIFLEGKFFDLILMEVWL